MGDLPGSGGAAELNVLSPSVGASLSENWAAADKACREIIRKVQPSPVSEERRRAVIHYIQRLIRNTLGAEVFPYGSVPLRTYLPDGDIDLTVFSGRNLEKTLANDMQCVLEEEERNPVAEFVVKDVQLILAEVKIVKCIVEDIVVDISFNQIGGLCTLCFLEQVDRMIGKNHLFKQSIILIKAWCYYESRVLGAHHGLISTYALETLVLYIFHLYHSTLDGPFDVLYKFLDYFSKFSWETYCISLDGPIRLLPLPTVIADLPEDSDRDLLLSRDFLNACVGVFTVPYREGESSRGFQLKHMNIIDPLKEINNLGRSVSRGNYFRIRSAFLYGAKKLAQILVEPQHSIAKELHKFFSNTMARHGGGMRPDVQHNVDEYFDEHAISRGDFQCGLGARFSGESDDLITYGLDGLKLSTDSDKSDRSEKNECQLVDKDEAVASSKTRDDFRDRTSIRLSRDSRHVDVYTAESLNSSDLAGDFASYLQCLEYGRWCFEFGFGMHPYAMPPFPSPYHWDSILPPLHYEPNGFHPNQAVYAVPPVLYQYGWEELSKPRGTGTYFPNMNVPPFHGYRQSSMKGRNQVTMRSPRNNGRNFPRTEPNHQVPFSPPHQNGNHSANGQFIPPPKGVAEFEEIVRPQNPVPSSPGTRKSQTASRKEQNRISSYQLKDEGDFPPLSV